MALLEQPIRFSSPDSKFNDLQSSSDFKTGPFSDLQTHDSSLSTKLADPNSPPNDPSIDNDAPSATDTKEHTGHPFGYEDTNKVSSGVDSTFQSNQSKSQRISFEDFIDLNDLLFEWADGYDNKDWSRLARILAPLMIVDYSIVGHERIDDLPAADFVSMMSSPAFLGDPLVRTQHLMGARKFERVSDTEVIGHHQIRAAHQRYCPDGVTVERRGHGHSYIKHWYLKVDGQWKLKGLCPKIYWNEKDFDKIFLQLKGQR